jgi:hypothetical protein
MSCLGLDSPDLIRLIARLRISSTCHLLPIIIENPLPSHVVATV